jgi:hypothetical protein
MSAHVCPRCRGRCFIWSGGEDEAGRDATLWGCGCCDYLAYEYNETQTRRCPHCQSAIWRQVLLRDAQRSYWWCSYCHRTDTVELISPA